tara:strand:+ start:823 stop:2505 length:1683 start_codon:yes stop_codon:yes gene_type:complete
MSNLFDPNSFSSIDMVSPFDPEYYSLERNLMRSMGLEDTAQPDTAPSTIADIFSRRADLRQDKKDLLGRFRDLSQERTRTSFVNPEANQKGFLDALKDPTEAQRNAFIAFGLGLAGSTGDLSQRLAAGLGQGVGALQKTREKEKARELQGMQFEMKELGLEGEALTQEFQQQKYLDTIARQARTDQLAQDKFTLQQFQAKPKVDQYNQLLNQAVENQDYAAAARYQSLIDQELYGKPNEVTNINNRIENLNAQKQSLDTNDPDYEDKLKRIDQRILDQENLKKKELYVSGGITIGPDGTISIGGSANNLPKTAAFDLETFTDMSGRAFSKLPEILVDPYFQSSTGSIAQIKFLPGIRLFGEAGGRELRARIKSYADEQGVTRTDFFKPLSEKEWPIARAMLAIDPELDAASNINIQVKTKAPDGLKAIQQAYTRTKGDLYGIQARMAVAQQMAMPFVNGHRLDPNNPFANGLDMVPEGRNASVKDLDAFFPTADSSARGQGYLVKIVNGQERLFPQEYVQSLYNRQMNSSNPADFIMYEGQRVTNIPYEFYVKSLGYSAY